MDIWLEQSIEYANQRSYLDDLFKVYPTVPDGLRSLDSNKWDMVEKAFQDQNNEQLIRALLALDLFPIKDSYVAYLKRDKTAIERNPATINRLAGRIYELGLDKVWENCSQPKETNRQIGPMFRNWIENKSLGITPIEEDEFLSSNQNAILRGNDEKLLHFAQEHFGFNRDKGIDFVARFGGQYVIGEAKFLTDFGGHQNAQMQDALLTVEAQTKGCIHVGILDGVLYIPTKNKLYQSLQHISQERHIMSALLLRNFLYSL